MMILLSVIAALAVFAALYFNMRYEREKERYERLLNAYFKTSDEVSQTLGKVLNYPWYMDDQKNFPGATFKDGVCVGEHVPESIAMEAATRITVLTKELAEAQAQIDQLKSK